MERRRKFRKKNAYSHIIVSADYLGPLRCWRCKIEQDQSQFKPLKYYVPVRKGYPVKMYVPACHKCRTDKKSKWFDNPLYTARSKNI